LDFLCHVFHDLDERRTSVGHLGMDSLLRFPQLADPRALLLGQARQTPIHVLLVLPGLVPLGQVVLLDADEQFLTL